MIREAKTNNYIKSDTASSNRTRRPILDERIGRQIGRFGQRLKEVIGKEPVRSFARRATISEGAVRQYMNGNRYPDLDFLAAITSAGNVNLLWLATGEGDKNAHEARGSPGGSEGCAGHGVDEAVLARSVEAVEEALALAGKEVPPDTKAKMVARVYVGLARPDSPADHAEIMRLIRSML